MQVISSHPSLFPKDGPLSQASLAIEFHLLFPHNLTHIEGEPLQLYKGEVKQFSQPSPLIVFASSQFPVLVSIPNNLPSPHIGVQIDGVPVQVYPEFTTQIFEQPSLGIRLPSSQYPV